jgi:hypothetical protein
VAILTAPAVQKIRLKVIFPILKFLLLGRRRNLLAEPLSGHVASPPCDTCHLPEEGILPPGVISPPAIIYRREDNGSRRNNINLRGLKVGILLLGVMITARRL